MHKRRFGLLVFALLGVALLLRAGPLYWSPLPSTLDGFGYAAQARDTLATGSLPLQSMRADNFGFTTLLALLGSVIGIAPLYLAQPLATIIGTYICLGMVAILRRVGAGIGWPTSAVRNFVGLALAGVAVEGLLLRRTLMPDEEILAHLLVLVLVIALYHALHTDDRRWYLLAALVIVVFPLTHTFTTFVAALIATALVVAVSVDRGSIRPLIWGGALVSAFWVHIAVYYGTAETTVLTVPYVDRVTAYPGLFLAWVILLVVGTAWSRLTTRRLRQAALLVPIVVFFAIVALNSVVTVFPGTVQTPRLVLGLVALLVVPALLAAGGIGWLNNSVPPGGMLVALFAGPAAIIGFSLTASLTPEYFATAMRAQTFLHMPVVGLAAIWIVKRVDTRRAFRLVGTAFVLVLLLTAPLAYLNMDTASAPSTTLSSEFSGVEFATATDDPWASDHSLSRVGILYFGVKSPMGPVAAWLNGGNAPDCTVVSQRSWTTTGAHLFPSAPATVADARYERWLRSRNVIYSNSGLDPVTVSQSPRGKCQW